MFGTHEWFNKYGNVTRYGNGILHLGDIQIIKSFGRDKFIYHIEDGSEHINKYSTLEDVIAELDAKYPHFRHEYENKYADQQLAEETAIQKEEQRQKYLIERCKAKIQSGYTILVPFGIYAGQPIKIAPVEKTTVFVKIPAGNGFSLEECMAFTQGALALVKREVGWNLTHIPSGLRILPAPGETVGKMMLDIANQSGIDWAVDEKEIQTNKELFDKITSLAIYLNENFVYAKANEARKKYTPSKKLRA